MFQYTGINDPLLSRVKRAIKPGLTHISILKNARTESGPLWGFQLSGFYSDTVICCKDFPFDYCLEFISLVILFLSLICLLQIQLFLIFSSLEFLTVMHCQPYLNYTLIHSARYTLGSWSFEDLLYSPMLVNME